MFKRKSTRGQDKLPTEVRISKEEIPLAQSDFNQSKIAEIQGRFQGGCTLLVPGRIFIREGTLLKVCRRGPKPRHFFLFNDVLVYGTVLSRGHYAQQHVLTLDQMSVSSECHFMPQVYSIDESQIDEHLDTDNAFQINHTNKSFHVFAPNLSDKNNWLSNLKKFMAKAQKGQENIQLVTRAVWVPDGKVTECMVCRKAKFSTFNRKHHCRNCGKVVCSACSSHKVDLVVFQGKTPKPGDERLERVCNECYNSLEKKSTNTKAEDVTSPKSITIVDARPMASSKKPDRPPPPAASASASADDVKTGKGVDDSGDDVTSSDSDDSDRLDDDDREELKTTRRASLLGGTSWEPSGEGETIPRAPPRKKKQAKEEQEDDARICVKCDKKLKIGEFGFLDKNCYCKEHFKAKYEEMQEDKPAEKPVPKPRRRKEKSEGGDEENEIADEEAEEDNSVSQGGEDERKPTAGRLRKPNRFKVKKVEEEENVEEKEVVTETGESDEKPKESSEGNLLLEVAPETGKSEPAQSAVDELLSMNETDAAALNQPPSQPLVSLETDPVLLGISSEPLVPDSSTPTPTLEDGSESPKKGRRKKTKFKSKLKEATD
ncbi:uncharacterized protein [Oscarella lobularis]|uniref:uncharacterized protein isoform X3 n=1 Tax=Oscarella lobularis TaxID=121494 RepID=UPI0033140F51